MAPKDRHPAASSSDGTALTTAGGCPSQYAPISGEWKWLSSLLRTRRGLLLNEVQNFFWSWAIDAELTGLCLICKCASRVNEQNVNLMIFPFLSCYSGLRVYELIMHLVSFAFWDFRTRVSFMGLAFESQDLEDFLSLQVWSSDAGFIWTSCFSH